MYGPVNDVTSLAIVKESAQVLPKVAPTSDIELATDPVCKMSVDERKTKFTSTHGERTFYFCSANCKATFDKDAHRYGH